MTSTEILLLVLLLLAIAAFVVREVLGSRQRESDRASAAAALEAEREERRQDAARAELDAAAVPVGPTMLEHYVGKAIQVSAAGKEWQGDLAEVGDDFLLIDDPQLGSSDVLDSRLLIPRSAITHVQVARGVR